MEGAKDHTDCLYLTEVDRQALADYLAGFRFD